MDHPKLEALKKAWHEKRSVTMVYILLRTSVVLVMLAQIFNRNFENVFLCVLTLILFMLPSTLERKLDLDLPNTHWKSSHCCLFMRRKSWARSARTT